MSEHEELIKAAIDKLTKQKAKSTPGSWFLTYESATYPRIWGNADDTDADHVATTARSHYDAELIVTLHRTTDAQLAILEAMLVHVSRPDHVFAGPGADLVRAINGVTS